ncbi:putative actin-dependent regulator protein [Halotydeus destructor]|nr:putative actin-dependent regulator protein [Halotydeus destructor]
MATSGMWHSASLISRSIGISLLASTDLPEGQSKSSPKSSSSVDSGIVPETPELAVKKRKRIRYALDSESEDNKSEDDSADEFLPTKKGKEKKIPVNTRKSRRTNRLESSDSNVSKPSTVADELGDFAFGSSSNQESDDDNVTLKSSREKIKLEPKAELELKKLKDKHPGIPEEELLEVLGSVNSIFKVDRNVKKKNSSDGFVTALPKKLENNPYLQNVYTIPLVKRTDQSTEHSESDIEVPCFDNTHKPPEKLKSFFARTTLLPISSSSSHPAKKAREWKPPVPKKKRRFIVGSDSDDSDLDGHRRETPLTKDEYEKDDFVVDDNEAEVNSDRDEYEEENFLSSTSEDEEPDSPIKKPKKKRANHDSTQPVKNEVLKFLQESEVADLLTIPTVSKKKAEIIISLRPFNDWHEVKDKIGNAKGLNEDVLDNAYKAIRSRDVVGKIMAECENLAESISVYAKNLKPIRQPSILNSEMKLSEYQLIGINWLLLMHQRNTNAILADEMGLGKTIQVIAFLAALREIRGIAGPHLIVVPSSTMDNWDRELSLWCQKIDVIVYYGSQAERRETRDKILRKEWKFDVLLTTYNMLQSAEDKVLFKKTSFEYSVFDEAHMLKNMNSTRYEQLMRVRTKRRLLLTGTPLQNNLLELMSLLIFTVPEMFDNKTDHVKKLFSSDKRDSDEKTKLEKDRIDLAKKIMTPFILRRLKKDVLTQLPKKDIEIRSCQMTGTQEKKYMSLIKKYTKDINTSGVIEEDEFEDGSIEVKRGAGMLMNLRKAANHPLLLRTLYTDAKLRKLSKLILKEPEYATDGNSQYIFEDMQLHSDFDMHTLCCKYPSLSEHKLSDELLVQSGKFEVLDELLPSLKEKKERVLIFSQFTMILDILVEYLRIRGHEYCRLDGATKVSERLDLIDQFNKEDSNLFVFLLSTKAGGMGINLTSANQVIIHDIDFNPYNDKQAEDRCHRIGQTKDVKIIKLISENTVEEGMLKIADEKLKLAEDLCDVEQGGKKDHKDMKNLLRQALGV